LKFEEKLSEGIKLVMGEIEPHGNKLPKYFA
jgi:hypothetical protein